MRFQIPQFIEIEDKIFGPLTLKQFIYLAGGAGLMFIIFRLLPLFLALPVMAAVAAFSAGLAFYKVHGRFPFIYLVEAAFKYYISGKLYIWKKEQKKVVPVEQKAREITGITVPKLSESKLKDLTWSLDIHESIYSNKNQR